MKTSSAKAKGRNLQKWVVSKLIEHLQLDEEDLEDPLLCPCCRHENNWHRHGVRIVNKRQNRRDNPAHVEYMIQKKFKM